MSISKKLNRTIDFLGVFSLVHRFVSFSQIATSLFHHLDVTVCIILMMHLLVIVLHLLVSEGKSNLFSYFIFLIAIPVRSDELRKIKHQIHAQGILVFVIILSLALRQGDTLFELSH